MNCPRCQTELKQIRFPELNVASVHMCPNCEGGWYPREDLETLANTDKDTIKQSDLAPVLVADKLELIDLDAKVNCPECGQEMRRYSYLLASDTELDRCDEHGIWLDDGELGIVLEQIASHRTETSLSREATAAKRKEMGIDKIAKGEPMNPFALTLRLLNGLFGKK